MKIIMTIALYFLLTMTGCAHTVVQKNVSPPASQDRFDCSLPKAPQFEENADRPLTLSGALALALTRNPELVAFSWEVRASEAQALQASLRPNPQLDLEIEEFAGSGPRRGFDSAETTIQLSQLIETAGKPAKRRAAANLETDLADWDYRSKRMDVLAGTSRAFVEVLSGQQSLETAQDLLNSAKQQLAAVTIRVDTGKDQPVELNKAQITVSQAQIRFTQEQYRLKDARRQLAAFWAGDEPVFKEVAGNLREIPRLLPFEQVRTGLSNNPDLARWATAIDHSKAVEELERANTKQDFTVSAGMQRFNETDDSAIVVGISIPLPLFDRNQGSAAAARFRTRKTEALQKAAQANLYANLSRAWQAFGSARAEVEEFETRLLEKAQDVFEMAQETYRLGKTDFLNVLDAQRTLYETRTQYIKALTACHLAGIEVDRLTGGLTNTATLTEESI